MNETPMHSAAPITTEPARRFAIALSFPGEVRARAEPIALRLAHELGRKRVLYDRFHEAELARLNFDVHLQALYHDHAELIVIFLCKDYNTKEWCRLEWRAIRDLIKQRQRDIILLRLDDALIPGVYSIDGYIDMRHKTDDEIAALILQRSSQQNGPKDDYALRQHAFSHADKVSHGHTEKFELRLEKGERIHVVLTAEHELDFVICTPSIYKKWRSTAKLTGSLHHARRTKDMTVSLVAKEAGIYCVLLINNTRRKAPIAYKLEIN
jgi:hypothetical protein